jgi:hypothetical protein
MPQRSIRITLQNNTDRNLTLIAAEHCFGSWTNNIAPPSVIAMQSTVSWEGESSGVLQGTEGWVKYEINNNGNFKSCSAELVYIHWDNPFVWDKTNPLDYSLTMTDVTPPCNANEGKWDNGLGAEYKQPSFCSHEIFGIDSQYDGGVQGITWWDVGVNWPILIGAAILGTEDISLKFTLGIRTAGSVRQTIGAQGIRPIAVAKEQPSVRALLHFK